MVSHNKKFAWGKIGLGSFDDLGLWDDVKINGQKVNSDGQPIVDVKKK